MAIRARTSAEWTRNASTRQVGLRKIDREAIKIDAKMGRQERAMVQTSQMGGRMANSTIAGYNQDVDPMCNYCNEDVSTAIHIKGACSYFETKRQQNDPVLSKVSRKYIFFIASNVA